MKLYSFFRSSASFRVRIALNLKGIEFETISINLLGDPAAPERGRYRDVNPQGLVPALAMDGLSVTQSIAICEYLEEAFPRPALLPATPAARARVRAIVAAIACDIHPLHSVRVVKELGGAFGATEAQRLDWARHWIGAGLEAIESLLADSPDTGEFCHGNEIGLADAFLVPQVASARLFNLALDAFPTIARIDTACQEHPAVIAALPKNQPDAA